MEDNDGFLVSAKLQKVALRTPPPTDSYLLQCHGAGQPGRPVRLPGDATFLDVLLRLGLVTPDEHRAGTPSVAFSEGGTRFQKFDIRPALGDGSANTAFPAVDLVDRAAARILDSPGVRYPFALFIAAVDISTTAPVDAREASTAASSMIATVPAAAALRDTTTTSSSSPVLPGTKQPVAALPDASVASGPDKLAGSMTMPTATEGTELFVQPFDNLRSRSQQRRDRRAQYEIERQRVQELEHRRAQSLMAIAHRQEADAGAARANALAEEARRQTRALAHLTAIGERCAKVESRAVVASEEKQAIELRRATCMLEAKVEFQQELERIRQRLQQSPETSAIAQVTPSAAQEEEAQLTKAGHLRLICSYNLPLSEETPDILLEKRQAAQSFVNRVVAAKKLNERRLTRFSTNAQHPMEKSACLTDALGSLKALVDLHHSETASHLTDARAAQIEATKNAYHTELMQRATEGRVELKMQRHRENLQLQVRDSRLAEARRQEAAEQAKALQREDQQHAEEFRERRRRVEENARKRAQEEKDCEIFMDRQRFILHQQQ